MHITSTRFTWKINAQATMLKIERTGRGAWETEKRKEMKEVLAAEVAKVEKECSDRIAASTLQHQQQCDSRVNDLNEAHKQNLDNDTVRVKNESARQSAAMLRLQHDGADALALAHRLEGQLEEASVLGESVEAKWCESKKRCNELTNKLVEAMTSQENERIVTSQTISDLNARLSSQTAELGVVRVNNAAALRRNSRLNDRVRRQVRGLRVACRNTAATQQGRSDLEAKLSRQVNMLRLANDSAAEGRREISDLKAKLSQGTDMYRALERNARVTQQAQAKEIEQLAESNKVWRGWQTHHVCPGPRTTAEPSTLVPAFTTASTAPSPPVAIPTSAAATVTFTSTPVPTEPTAVVAVDASEVDEPPAQSAIASEIWREEATLPSLSATPEASPLIPPLSMVAESPSDVPSQLPLSSLSELLVGLSLRSPMTLVPDSPKRSPSPSSIPLPGSPLRSPSPFSAPLPDSPVCSPSPDSVPLPDSPLSLTLSSPLAAGPDKLSLALFTAPESPVTMAVVENLSRSHTDPPPPPPATSAPLNAPPVWSIEQEDVMKLAEQAEKPWEEPEMQGLIFDEDHKLVSEDVDLQDAPQAETEDVGGESGSEPEWEDCILLDAPQADVGEYNSVQGPQISGDKSHQNLDQTVEGLMMDVEQRGNEEIDVPSQEMLTEELQSSDVVMEAEKLQGGDVDMESEELPRGDVEMEVEEGIWGPILELDAATLAADFNMDVDLVREFLGAPESTQPLADESNDSGMNDMQEMDMAPAISGSSDPLLELSNKAIWGSILEIDVATLAADLDLDLDVDLFHDFLSAPEPVQPLVDASNSSAMTGMRETEATPAISGLPNPLLPSSSDELGLWSMEDFNAAAAAAGLNMDVDLFNDLLGESEPTQPLVEESNDSSVNGMEQTELAPAVPGPLPEGSESEENDHDDDDDDSLFGPGSEDDESARHELSPSHSRASSPSRSGLAYSAPPSPTWSSHSSDRQGPGETPFQTPSELSSGPFFIPGLSQPSYANFGGSQFALSPFRNSPPQAPPPPRAPAVSPLAAPQSVLPQDPPTGVNAVSPIPAPPQNPPSGENAVSSISVAPTQTNVDPQPGPSNSSLVVDPFVTAASSPAVVIPGLGSSHSLTAAVSVSNPNRSRSASSTESSPLSSPPPSPPVRVILPMRARRVALRPNPGQCVVHPLQA